MSRAWVLQAGVIATAITGIRAGLGDWRWSLAFVVCAILTLRVAAAIEREGL